MAGGDEIRVLHVDDDEAFLDVAAAALERADTELAVTTETDPDRAVERVADERIDCVVSDYDMPGTDGLALFEAVREVAPELPFVLFTGKGSEEIAAEAVSAGVTDYLQKAVGTDQFTVLSNRVRNAVERARAREAAERERDRAATLVRSTPDPVVEVRFENDEPVIVDANPAFEETFGFDPERVIGRPLDELVVPPEASEEAADINERARAGEEFRTEVRRQTADGLRDFLLTAVPFRDGGFAIYTDITAQKDRQRALAARERKVETLHEVAVDFDGAASHQDVHDRIIDAAEGILEFDLAVSNAVEGRELVPQAVSSALGEDSYYGAIPIDADDRKAAEVYRTGEVSLIEDIAEETAADPADPAFRSALTVPIGEYGVFQAAAEDPGAFDDDDRRLTDILLTHAVETLRRLDRERELERRTEQLTRQNERLESFASVVSHDLTSPLNVASGRLRLARESHPDDDDLGVVARAHDRMERILDDVLTMIRDGTLVEETEPVSLADAVDGCRDAVATDDATITVREDRTVAADPDRFDHVIQNLLANAVDHAADDEESGVRVRVGPLPDGFYVADDGPGIPADEREAVFEAGYSTSEDGTGLGLSIVREMIEAHGWDVRVTDGDAGGARFEITGVEMLDTEE
ncbi:MAG: ATP-binding protein [Halobaculum sp.]